MELTEFIKNLSDQFDELEIGLNESTQFQQLEEWSSLTAMGIIAMAKTEYGKTITGREVRSCTTVKELYDLIASK